MNVGCTLTNLIYFDEETGEEAVIKNQWTLKTQRSAPWASTAISGGFADAESTRELQGRDY